VIRQSAKERSILSSETSRPTLVPTQTPLQAMKSITSKDEKLQGRLTTHLRLMPRLRMNGTVILSVWCAVVVCTKLQLKFYIICLLKEWKV